MIMGMLNQLAMRLTFKIKSNALINRKDPPQPHGDVSVFISSSTKKIASMEHECLLGQLPETVTKIYTDGSLGRGGSGIGFVIYSPNLKRPGYFSASSRSRTDINNLETHCILKAIHTAKKLNLPGPYYVFSDSQAALKKIHTETNQYSSKIQLLSNDICINLHWCPGHSGIEGNILADRLARKFIKELT
ncbi:hypothetical protein K3495_g6412 [Podosphaera aphanis]|nr:hypothetical protein K3495_g6412 [Podosphaera aphanis]